MRWPWARQVKERSASFSVSDPALLAALGRVPGEVISAHGAMSLSAWYRGVALVAGSIASLDLRTIEEDPASGTRTPVGSFLDTPGGDMLDPFQWKELVMLYLLNHGNCYLQKRFNGAGALSSLYPVHPFCVVPEWDDSRPGGKVFRVNVTRMSGGQATSESYDLDASRMTQIMGPSLDGLRGLSPISMARLSLGTTAAGEKAANRQFTNGGLISGMVTPQGDEEIDLDEATKIKQDLEVHVLGAENAGSIPVINRKLQFSPWQLSAADAQFIESRTFQVIEISRWLGVPPHLLSETEKATSWGSGIAEQNQGLARYTLQPWTKRIDAALTPLITNPRRCAEFDYSQFVKPSPVDETNMLNTQVNGGWITPNEARAARGLPPIAGGDALRIPPGAAAPAPVVPGGPIGIVGGAA
ncbi:MAG TPA: phage portal protein [Pseudonocardiaceae bacterium]|nr:phage portal protein [Pseudonocardiaceae bacterium]